MQVELLDKASCAIELLVGLRAIDENGATNDSNLSAG